MTEKLLTARALRQARTFVTDHARPLERVRLAHLMGAATEAEVAMAVRDFVTPDGGIGRALESDCRAPEASALGALTALDILRMHGVPGTDPLVALICGWLVANVETDEQNRAIWPFVPPAAQASPHAPWWDQSRPGELALMFNGYVANPGVALTAHLWRFEAAAPGSVPGSLLAQLTAQAIQVAATGIHPDEVNAHDALAHFAAEPAVPQPARAAVTAYLRAVLPERVMGSVTDFASYGIHPLWVAPRPDHPLATAIPRQLTLALDHTIASQEANGSWAPFWDWGGRHPQVWAQAEREWRGVLIVRNIAALQAHGRVDVS